MHLTFDHCVEIKLSVPNFAVIYMHAHQNIKLRENNEY